jgi:hypothetical protein
VPGCPPVMMTITPLCFRKDDGSTFYSEVLHYTTDSVYTAYDWLTGSNQCPFKADAYRGIQTK